MIATYSSNKNPFGRFVVYMKAIKNILVKIYTFYVVVIFSIFMILLLPVFLLPLLVGEKHGNITYFGLAVWAWIFSKLTFIQYKIKGRKQINRKQSYIYTCNHTSFLDIPGIVLSIPTQFRPLAKKELLKIPVFGIICRFATIIVDRSNPESRLQSVKKLTRFLRDGLSILIFPEGTQNRTVEVLQPFYDGAFRIALETKTPILPMVIVNAGKLMHPATFKIHPGKIKVVFGEPISVEGLTISDVKELKSRVYDVMESMVNKEQGH